ncbi:MAG: secretion system protein [Acidobacteria bacterium RIFCSPLOWO2_12_FULL_60_22]|nr:MAG: secretion system protein [Acidobacteria bacterium RIFCSPLOWO2_12_FULL_60_22]
MPEYVCRIANDRGQIQKQVERAASEEELRDRFAQQGFLVYSIRPRPRLGVQWKPSARGKKVKLSEFLVFNQQFVTLIRAGLPILKALDLLGGHIAQPSLRSCINEIRDSVRGGALLSEAFREQGVFSEIYTTTLLAGEKSGNMEGVLDRYINYQRTALSVKRKLAASLVYPALLVTMVLILVTFLVSYVIPSFAELYRTMSQELPPITQALIAFSDGFKRYWIVLMVLLAGTGFGGWLWKATPQGGQSLDRLKMKVPLAGEIWTKYQVAQFCRMLGTLLAGGIPMVQALDTAQHSVVSPLLRHALEVGTRQVREGKALWQGLSQAGFFPELAIEMIEVGESSGALAQMLASVADFFEEDVNTSLAALLSLIEPAILIFMGGVVALVLIALYLPIFSLAGRI